MSLTPILPRLLSGLLNGNRVGNPLQNGANPLDDGPGGDHGPSGDDFIESLPPGIERQLQMRGMDGLPPGLARQLAQAPQPPGAPPSSTANQPPGSPASPANAGSGNPTQAQGANQTPFAGQTAQAATSAVAMATTQAAQNAPFGARAANAANPAMPAAAANPATATAASAASPASTIPAGTTSNIVIPASPRTPDAVAAQARADAVPTTARTDPGALDRLAGWLRPMTDVARTLLPALVVRDAAQAAQAAQAMPLTNVPPLAAPPPQAIADARALGITGNERAPVTRSDVVMTPVYTGTGPARRGGRLDGFQSALQRMRSAADAENDDDDTPARERRADKNTWFALQWMFWILAVVAYGCLALALIAFLPAGAAVIDINRIHPWASTTVLLGGLAAAAAAWWLARRLMRKMD